MAATTKKSNHHVSFQRGTCPIVLSIPHGGTYLGSELEDRTPQPEFTSFCIDGDLHSFELGQEIAARFSQLAHHELWVVAGLLSRRKCDYNRRAEEAFPPTCSIAEQSYRTFYALIAEALDACVAEFGFALLFDLHGQSHDPLTELGYLLGKLSLSEPDGSLDKHAKTSLEQIHLRTKLGRADLIRGEPSFGARLASHGFFSCPSPLFPDISVQPVCVVAQSLDGLAVAAEAHHPHHHKSKQARHCQCCDKCCTFLGARCCSRSLFYSGGHITRVASARSLVGAIQAETPHLVRNNPSIRALFATSFSQACLLYTSPSPRD